uniref:(California timema) hypothetical protein n=1 Tax=Timema californicum TaxID=61474 RepID=A0A7R9PCU9_TIMCA|nr:unnamed protein product [Timema californicum]
MSRSMRCNYLCERCITSNWGGSGIKKRHHLINASQYHLTLSTPSHKQDNVSPRATVATSRARLAFAIVISILDLMNLVLPQPGVSIVNLQIVYVIGDEILKGQVRDTNSHFIVKRLYDLGVRVQRVCLNNF